MINIENIMNCLYTGSDVKYIITKKEAEYVLDEYPEKIFCRGILKEICFDFITDNRAKIYTKKV